MQPADETIELPDHSEMKSSTSVVRNIVNQSKPKSLRGDRLIGLPDEERAQYFEALQKEWRSDNP